MGEVHTEEGPKADILVLIEGRARYLAHLGHVKTPEILRGCADEITRLRAALAEALIKAYDVGFANSGEGYNGEYGADVSSDYYIQTRAEALALINNQSNGENNAKS